MRSGSPGVPAWKAATGPCQTSDHAVHRRGVGLVSDRECPYLTARSGKWRARPDPQSGNIDRGLRGCEGVQPPFLRRALQPHKPAVLEGDSEPTTRSFTVWVVVGTPWKRKAPLWRRDSRPRDHGLCSDLISGSPGPLGERTRLWSRATEAVGEGRSIAKGRPIFGLRIGGHSMKASLALLFAVATVTVGCSSSSSTGPQSGTSRSPVASPTGTAAAGLVGRWERVGVPLTVLSPGPNGDDRDRRPGLWSVEKDPERAGGGYDVGFGDLLEPSSRARVTTAMAAVIQSVTAWRVRTTTAPHRAPPAAAVAPVTNALIWGLPRWRMNQRPGTTTPR